MPTAETIAIGRVAEEELARRHVLDFAQRTVPGYKVAPHLQQIAELLEAAERGDVRRLCISTFPGSGKSTLLSAFVSWLIGRSPEKRVITASASSELAERNSRASRAMFTDASWPFDIELSKATYSQTRWDTTKSGGCFAIGVEGQITGWRGSVICADDVMNSHGTQTERDALWNWWREILMPRLEPGGSVILVNQRWGTDDIVQRVIESGEDWMHVSLAAIDGAGNSAWPDRWPLEELERQRVAMGSRAFETAFMGRPIAVEGNLIKAEWLQRYDKAPEHFEKVVCALDAAAKTGVRNDYSAVVKIGVTENSYYVLDVWRDRVEFPSLIRRVKYLEGENPRPSTIYVEDTSNAVALIQELRQSTTFPIVPVAAKGSKESRVEGITGALEAKRVFLPNEAPWLLDFERELLSFPLGRHDDMVDAFTLALSQLASRKGEIYFAEIAPAFSWDSCSY